MLYPHDPRYKQRESSAEQMHIALGEFTLAHIKEMGDEMTKMEYHVGNLQGETFVFTTEDKRREFYITTEYFYGRREVWFTHSESTIEYHYTLKDI